MRIEGKVVLITGASKGIGAACAAELERRGARLALTARSEADLGRVGGPGAARVAGDITQPEVQRRVIERTLEAYGALDILINNAGLGLYGASWKASPEEARRLFELNFFAPLSLTRLAIPHLRRGGAVVNVSSIAGKVTLPWMTLYSVSKFALGSWSEGLRMELEPRGIHVLEVCPGYVKTGFQSHALGARPPETVQKGRRFAITPEQCARAIARGLERDARIVLTPRAGWLFVLARRLFPAFVEARLARLARETA
ncbi:MAG: SDR family NAD(P)-dependent oxidoreductase [Acidobacteria bacterium]|nr:SDR family NAD(P)-dependent oxidoreductase [Acidobacteriota bacterium]